MSLQMKSLFVGSGVGACLGTALCYVALSQMRSGNSQSQSNTGVDATAFACMLGGCGEEPLVVVSGTPVRYVDLPPPVRQGLHDRILAAWVDSREQLSAFAASIAIAKERGDNRPLSELPSLENWVAAEPVDDAAVAAYFEANKTNFRAGTTLAQVRDQIRQVLRNKRLEEIKTTKAAELAAGSENSRLELRLAPPRHADVPPPSALFTTLPMPPGSVSSNTSSAGSSAASSAASSNTEGTSWLVEFTSYTCDGCAYSKLQVDEFLKTSKEPIRFVRLAAGPTDTLTNTFAKALFCAAKISPEAHQAFDVRAYQPAPVGYDPFLNNDTAQAAARAHILRVAREAGIQDETAFDSCLSSADATGYLEQVTAYAKAAGANAGIGAGANPGSQGTTLVFNGQRVPGGASGLSRFASWSSDFARHARAQK